jgi:hypothetical protein
MIGGYPQESFEVESIELSSGANRLDQAVLVFNLGHPSVRSYVQNVELHNLSVPGAQGRIALHGAQVNLYADVGGRTHVYHWGKLSLDEPRIGDGERLTLVSRTDRTLFGKPLGFQRVWDPQTRSANFNANGTTTGIYSDHEVEFNPESQGLVAGNKRVESSGGGSGLPYPIFISPDSVRTAAASLYQRSSVTGVDNQDAIFEQAAENWNLIEAVQYLCGECNGAQTFITNPTLQQLRGVLDGDRGILKGHKVQLGLYLPDALESLLEPYGYSFYVAYESTTRRVLKIFEKGRGTERTLKLQAAGSQLDTSKTNLDQLDVQYDISRAVNQVRVVGAFTQVEAAFDLWPAWNRQYDNVALRNLIQDLPYWTASPQYHRVWRDFVLNEAGDYQGQPYNLTELFQRVWGSRGTHPPVVARRRKFLPTLSRALDGKPAGEHGGCRIEWWNPNKTGGAGYELLATHDPTFACRLLDKECGITFTGAVPPLRIRNAIRSMSASSTQAPLRITATIESDSRINYFAPRRTSSVNPDINQVTLDVHRRFHWRMVDSSSVFHALGRAEGIVADTADSRDVIASFGDRVRDAWDQASCAGEARLEGIDRLDYQLSDLITGVVGRSVHIALTRAVGTDARRAQIVGVRYLPQQQKTTLILDSFRETDAWLSSMIRKTRRIR